MRRAVYIRLTLVLLCAIGVILFIGNPGTRFWGGTPVAQGIVSATIVYTNGGYSPVEVTVKQGEAVRWKNNSNHEMWPASSVHPTHSIYPEKRSTDCLGSSFDACKRIAPGEIWEFTFHIPGTWKFHDHVRPSHTGTVIVVP